MTAKKVRDMLLENECKQAEKNNDKVLNATAFAHCNFDNQDEKASGCQHCHKPSNKEDLC